MSLTLEVNNKAYAKLLVKVLPQPIRDERELARLTKMLLGLDERDDLTPEGQALAEVLTLLIEDYEEKRYSMPRVSPNELSRRCWEIKGGH